MKKITCDRCGKDITNDYHKDVNIKFISKLHPNNEITLHQINDKQFCIECFPIVCKNVEKIINVKVNSPAIFMDYDYKQTAS